ncbi:flagellar basal body P-ring formation chaperone FlgA [Geobacter argillaceus]|uniref:Flagella basal body P-ring formation protein FlgA n=1 Tax=Geobacter argillaceus TaxID=345631 RepID=A0A562VJU3_9BACT|nr:flagellar basal body P-ring formation chaperone FlgA [Geobacter argillaceus]TWJ18054.1 flagella basal body P-ring formation protein FlgA [Geobacter argillaceus]
MKRLVCILIAVLCSVICTNTAPAGPGKVVKEAEVRRIIVDFIRERTVGLGVEVNVKKVGFYGDLALPEGNVNYEVSAPRQWEGWGQASLALIVRVNDRVVKNVPVMVDVEALVDLVVTTRPVESGEILTLADVAVQKRDLAASGGKVARTAADVVGLKVRVGMRGNTPLRTDYLERIPLVKSGQLVTVLLESPALRITTTGRAKGAGTAGELITVQNIGSNKDFPARIVDAGTVRVDF